MRNAAHYFGFAIAAAIATAGVPALATGTALHVVPARALQRWWVPASHVPPRYPLDAVRDGAEGCVAVAFEIGSRGDVSMARVWRAAFTNRSPGLSAELERSSLQAIRRSRWAPAPANSSRAPVYTYVIDTYALSISRVLNDDTRKLDARIRAKCTMPDFEKRVQALAGTAQTHETP